MAFYLQSHQAWLLLVLLFSWLQSGTRICLEGKVVLNMLVTASLIRLSPAKKQRTLSLSSAMLASLLQCSFRAWKGHPLLFVCLLLKGKQPNDIDSSTQNWSMFKRSSEMPRCPVSDFCVCVHTYACDTIYMTSFSSCVYRLTSMTVCASRRETNCCRTWSGFFRAWLVKHPCAKSEAVADCFLCFVLLPSMVVWSICLSQPTDGEWRFACCCFSLLPSFPSYSCSCTQLLYSVLVCLRVSASSGCLKLEQSRVICCIDDSL